MDNKKLNVKPGSPLRTIINNQFLSNKRFCKWFFKTFSKIELKFFSEYYYEDLANRTEIIWFKDWFLKWYLSEQNCFKVIAVLTAIQKKAWTRPDGSTIMSVHPPKETIQIKDAKHPEIFIEATPFVSAKDGNQLSIGTKQQNYTNVILGTIGNQLNRVEEKILEIIPEKGIIKEIPSTYQDPFYLKSFKKYK